MCEFLSIIFTSLLVNEESTRPVVCFLHLGSTTKISFSALTVSVRQQEGNPARYKAVPLIFQASLQQQMDKENIEELASPGSHENGY